MTRPAGDRTVRFKRALFRFLRFVPYPVLLRMARFFTPRFTVGVEAVVVCTETQEFLEVRNPYRPRASPPGGLVRRGENPEAAMTRELREETGLRCGERLRAGSIDYDSVLRWITWRFYLEVSAEERAAVTPASAEVSSIAWSPFGNAGAAVRTVLDRAASGDDADGRWQRTRK